MNEAESKNYMRGLREAYRELLGTALRGLGRDDVPDDVASAQRRIAALESELAAARVQLRMLCKDFGDNDWEDDDHLADVIERHLGKHLHSGEVEAIDFLRKARVLIGSAIGIDADHAFRSLSAVDAFLAGLGGEDEGEAAGERLRRNGLELTMKGDKR